MDLYYGMSEEEYRRVMRVKPDEVIGLPDDHPQRAWRVRMKRDGIGKCSMLQKAIAKAIVRDKEGYHILSMYDKKEDRMQGQILTLATEKAVHVGLWLALCASENGEDGFPIWHVEVKDAVKTFNDCGPNIHNMVWEMIASYLPELLHSGMNYDVYMSERSKGLAGGDPLKCLETCGENGLYIVEHDKYERDEQGNIVGVDYWYEGEDYVEELRREVVIPASFI